MLNYIAIIEPF